MKKINPFQLFYQEYLSQHKYKLMIAMFFSVIAGISFAYGPKKIGNLTSLIYEGILRKIRGNGGIDYQEMTQTLLLIFGIYLIAVICLIIEGNIMTKVTQRCLSKMKNTITHKMNQIKLSERENELKNQEMIHIYGEVDILNQFFNIIFHESILIISIMIGAVYFMFSTSVPLAFITAIVVPLLMIVIKFVNYRYQKKKEIDDYRQAKLDNQLSEIIDRYKLIRLLNCKTGLLKELDRVNERAKKSGTSIKKTTMHLEAYSSLIGNSSYVFILALGFYLYQLGKISIGDIQTFTLYNKLMERPIFLLTKISNIFYAIRESLQKIFDFLALEEEKNNGNEAFINGDIVVQNLSFQYSKEQPVLKQLNFRIQQGQKVAIVGKTGSGKSTILKLLLRFYDQYEGEITIGDKNIKNLNIKELRQEIGIVPQDIWLFNGTIKENLLYGNENATEEQIIDVMKKLGLHEFIKKLPEKYETQINSENSNLSSGQKQILCIARMMLKNPSIIFLDEATNLLDYITEENVKNELQSFIKTKTCLIIAHRLSTITESDNILVLDQGSIVENGTHQELIKQKQKYYEMYQQLSKAL